jgi:hypothetical protein
VEEVCHHLDFNWAEPGKESQPSVWEPPILELKPLRIEVYIFGRKWDLTCYIISYWGSGDSL